MASSRPIQRLGLDVGIVERLKGVSIHTLKDLLTTSPLVLMLSLDISLSEAELIQKQASTKVACDRNHTALELLQTRTQQRIYLPTGLQKLDSIMLGGLNMGTITEITGPPGVGKTQFCIGCCVEAIARSHPFYGTNQRNSVIYIDTEHKFDCTRLAEVASHRYPGLYGPEQDEEEIGALLDHVKIMRPSTCKELYEMISTLQPIVISDHVSLIVVDSMAALARRESLNEHDKEQFVVNQASMLKMMAELCHCTVICTNQIMVEHVANQSRVTNHASVFVTATLLPQQQQSHNRSSVTTATSTTNMIGSSLSGIPSSINHNYIINTRYQYTVPHTIKTQYEQTYVTSNPHSLSHLPHLTYYSYLVP